MAHGGNLRQLARQAGCSPEDILDFSANLNPLGPPDWLRPLVASQVSALVHYPDPDCADLTQAACARHGVSADQVVCGNGVSDIIAWLPRLAGQTGLGRAVIPTPAYDEYQRACTTAGLAVEALPLKAGDGFALDLHALDAALNRGPALVFVGQPANPAGNLTDPHALRELARAHPRSLLAVDEAFADFVPGLDRLTRECPSNMLVLLSLTKILAVPGLRVGLAVAAPDWAAGLRSALPPWTVNTLAQAVGARGLQDAGYLERTARETSRLRESLLAQLAEIPGLRVLPGAANYLLCKLENGRSARELSEHCLRARIAIRTDLPGLGPGFFRIAVRPKAQNSRLADVLADFCGVPRTPVAKAVPAVMVLGCSSDAGKSVLAAGVCRALRNRGLNVLPFKAQNMSLNSGVTAAGEEMGRAQILQAAACGVEPEAAMNPVLLKPTGETGSQVIVLGKPIGNMRVREYVRKKAELWQHVANAYGALARRADVMVLEGAGSPAEVNLKAHDIVNMRMAMHARAKVVLVADIDRGGAFAHLLGTMDCLTEAERGLVCGLVLNKFRGDESLLDSAINWIENATGKPVLGVVPFLPDLNLPDEDSVAFKAGRSALLGKAAELDIAVIDLPRASNLTDLDALAAEPDVSLRKVSQPAELGHPDAAVLPGSRNTVRDLLWLRESGLEKALRNLLSTTAASVVGICGGYQMLGAHVADPLGLEGQPGSVVAGLGLLPLVTELAEQKTLARTQAVCAQSGLCVSGYEIHHGQTVVLAQGGAETPLAALVAEDGRALGHQSPCGRVFGTYMHGVFDAPAYRGRFLDGLRAKKGLPPASREGAPDAALDAALDRLAAVLEDRLDMDALLHQLF